MKRRTELFRFRPEVQPGTTLWVIFLWVIISSVAAPAGANEPDFEFWSSSDFLLKLRPDANPELAWHDIIPHHFRVYTELQFADDTGLQQALVRVGPVWNPVPWFLYAMHLTSVAQSDRNGQFAQSMRFEIEPTFSGQFLPELRWSNRHRLDYRLKPNGPSWNYSARFGLNNKLPVLSLTAFASDEIFFRLSDMQLNQNRAQLGISYQLDASTQLSLSYLFRAVFESQWVFENGVFLSLSYSSHEKGFFQDLSD